MSARLRITVSTHIISKFGDWIDKFLRECDDNGDRQCFEEESDEVIEELATDYSQRVYDRTKRKLQDMRNAWLEDDTFFK